MPEGFEVAVDRHTRITQGALFLTIAPFKEGSSGGGRFSRAAYHWLVAHADPERELRIRFDKAKDWEKGDRRLAAVIDHDNGLKVERLKSSFSALRLWSWLGQPQQTIRITLEPLGNDALVGVVPPASGTVEALGDPAASGGPSHRRGAGRAAEAPAVKRRAQLSAGDEGDE